MAELDKLFSTTIKHKGLFNFKDTYQMIYEWLVAEGYDIEEKTYKETVGPGGEKDLEIEWKALKKISDYFRFVIKVDWQILRMTSTDVEIEGVKRGMNKGQLNIKISSILEKDYESKWETSPFMKFLRTVYDRYLITSRIERYEAKLIGEADELIAQVKAFLQLSSV